MQKSTTPQFIEKAKLKHGDTYDYSLVEYVNISTPVNIICKSHNIFIQKPSDHLQGYGCRLCGVEKVSKQLSSNIETYTVIANRVHNNTYDYSESKYVNSSTKIIIICKTHGQFLMRPNDHLSNKQGCPKCGHLHKSQYKNLIAKQTFIEKANNVHNQYYDYSQTVYTKSNNKIDIICPEHGIFQQIANDHLNGSGCKQCTRVGKSGYSEDFFIQYPNKKNTECKLYLLKLQHDNVQFLKLGITTQDIKHRVNEISRKYRVEVINIRELPLYDAFNLEQKLLKDNKSYRFFPPIPFGGKTECLKYSRLEQLLEYF
jgi:hypothetical protein